MTFKKAVANEAAAQAAKKQFEAEVAKNKPQVAFKEAFDFTTVFYGGTIESVKDVSKARQNTVVKEAEKDVSIFETIRKKYDAEADKLQQSLAKIFGPSNGSGNISNTEQSDLQIMAKLELEATDRWVAKLKKKLKESQDVLKNERIKLFTTPAEKMQEDDKRSKYFDKRTKDLLEQSDKGGFGAKMQGIFKKDMAQIESEDAEKKRLDELTQSYARFAETLSGTVTNALFDVYDAMQQGQNPLEAMANMFAQIARNIAAAVIQALILEKLMNAFPALKGAFTALGLIGKAVGGVQAAGAIQSGVSNSSSFNAGSIATNNSTQGEFVLRGSDLVLATQRANNNLNIRRGY